MPVSSSGYCDPKINHESKIRSEKEKYPELKIEKTTNRIENLFSKLKEKLIVHHGLSKKNNILFIKNFLNKYS